MTRTAIFAGSFDPVTKGHLDVLRQAMRLADRLVVAVGVHPGKTPLFPADDRMAMIRDVVEPLAAEHGVALDVRIFDGLVVDAARNCGASIMVRGLRDGSDFDYEMQMAGLNAQLAPGLQTVFLPASLEFRALSATFVRQIAAMKGDVSAFVVPAVAQRLARRFDETSS